MNVTDETENSEVPHSILIGLWLILLAEPFRFCMRPWESWMLSDSRLTRRPMAVHPIHSHQHAPFSRSFVRSLVSTSGWSLNFQQFFFAYKISIIHPWWDRQTSFRFIPSFFTFHPPLSHVEMAPHRLNNWSIILDINKENWMWQIQMYRIEQKVTRFSEIIET